jgi:ATP-dependent Clp protease ATP-binding subunit ClpX
MRRARLGTSDQLPMDMTPSEIVRQLDQYVVGQDEAKKILAVAVYWHFRKSARSALHPAHAIKSNILLIGSTGTGKTLLCETLARVLDVPFVTADAGSLAQSEFVNHEIEAILQRLLDKAGGDVAQAGRGVVFIDEVDKLKSVPGHARAASGESVQHALLKIMEGAPVRLREGRYVYTTHVLFICGGAFVGLDDILRDTQAYGFISLSGTDNPAVLTKLNTQVKPTDLRAYGLIPEFAGRLPIVARLQDLSRSMLVRIMVEPRHSIYNQYRDILREDGVDLDIEAVVFEQIADLALEYQAGARSLRGIFESLMTDVLYVLADDPGIRRVSIASLFDEPRYN